METIIIQPANIEQLKALKAFLKSMQINFKAKEVINEDVKYDFSNLAGKLEWDGNALEEQQKLRDEWD